MNREQKTKDEMKRWSVKIGDKEYPVISMEMTLNRDEPKELRFSPLGDPRYN
jgi:hypothetical protein